VHADVGRPRVGDPGAPRSQQDAQARRLQQGLWFYSPEPLEVAR